MEPISGKRRKLAEDEEKDRETPGRKLVNKIITRTQSISHFVKNTPLKFGSMRKKSFAMAEAMEPLSFDRLEHVGSASSAPLLNGPVADFKEGTQSKKSHGGSRKRDLFQHANSMATIPLQTKQLRPSVAAAPYRPIIGESDGWILELGCPAAVNFASLTQMQTAEARWYSELFFGKDHTNYVAEEDQLGFVSISLVKDDGHCKALVRTSAGEMRLTAPLLSAKSSTFGKADAKALLKSALPNYHFRGLSQVKDDKHPTELRTFESNESHVRFKWGVLYCKKGQSTENEMFQNTETSERFTQFLRVLGEETTLLGFKGYHGGLDTTSACD